MSETKRTRAETVAAYARALDQADFETMADIHHQAETDPELERQLNELLAAEGEEPTPQEVLETIAMMRGTWRRGPARN